MSSTIKTVGVIAGVVLVLFGLWVTDNFIYPLKSDSPNFSDVEKAFAKLQFPSDWTEISSSENKGMFGRGCDPFNDSGCFHKSKTFKVPEFVDKVMLKTYLIQSGCPGVVEREFTYDGEVKRSFNLECGLGSGLQLGATIKGPESQVSVTVRTY